MNAVFVTNSHWDARATPVHKDIIRFPPDLKHFAKLTRNRTVVFDHRQLASLPHHRALENRNNILFHDDQAYSYSSPDRAIDTSNCTLIYGLDNLLAYLHHLPRPDVFLIGGDDLINFLLPYCDRAYVTVVQDDHHFPLPHSHFKNLDEDENWLLMSSSTHHHLLFDYDFRTYARPSTYSPKN